ncbi:MAG: hypothetical protein V8R50_08395 [Clostridia bacterium]
MMTMVKKIVKMLGYTPEQYKLFTKNAWIVLLAFSVLYCMLYCGRQNLNYMMPAMMAEEGWTELDLGILIIRTILDLWTRTFVQRKTGRNLRCE